MTLLALEVAFNHSDQYAELKKAQSSLEEARCHYELGEITRAEYISATEKCIHTIRTCSPPYIDNAK
ncbi:MAG: hypothetical protein V7765_14195 [Oleispira sp.]